MAEASFLAAVNPAAGKSPLAVFAPELCGRLKSSFTSRSLRSLDEEDEEDHDLQARPMLVGPVQPPAYAGAEMPRQRRRASARGASPAPPVLAVLWPLTSVLCLRERAVQQSFSFPSFYFSGLQAS